MLPLQYNSNTVKQRENKMFKVYCGDGTTSIPLADLDDAKEWARESNLAYEIANVETQTIVYTSQDQEDEEDAIDEIANIPMGTFGE